MKKILNFSVCLILILALIVPSNLTALASSEIPGDEAVSEGPDLVITDEAPLEESPEPSQNPVIEPEEMEEPIVLPEPSQEPDEEFDEEEPEVSLEPSAEPTSSPDVLEEQEGFGEELPKEDIQETDDNLDNALMTLLAEVESLYETDLNEAWLGSLKAEIIFVQETGAANDNIEAFQKKLDDYKALKSLLEEVNAVLAISESEELSQKLEDFAAQVSFALENGASYEEIESLQTQFMEIMVMPLAEEENLNELKQELLALLSSGKVYDAITARDKHWPADTKKQFTSIIEKEIDNIPEELIKDAVNKFKGKNKTQKGNALQALLNAVKDSYYDHQVIEGSTVGALIGSLNGAGKFYTYCAQKILKVPTAGVKFMMLDADADSILAGVSAELSRAIEAGYPLDLYGLAQLDEIGNNAYRGQLTQSVVWAVIAGKTMDDINNKNDPYIKEIFYSGYARALFEYAVTGKLPEGFSDVPKTKASVTVDKQYLKDGALPLTGIQTLAVNSEMQQYPYSAAFYLEADKVVKNNSVTVKNIPENGKLYYAAKGSEDFTELKENDTVPITAELRYISSEYKKDKNEIQFSYVSYEKVSSEFKSLQSFDIATTRGTGDGGDDWIAHQKMIGYQMEEVMDTLTLYAAGKANISVDPTPSPDVTPSPNPSPSPDVTPNPDPSPSPDVTPNPDPSPSPDVTPNPDPSPSPDVTPNPDPSPSPDVTPSPSPSPGPDVTPAPTPRPTPWTPSNPTPSNPTVPVTPSAPPLDEEEIDIPDEEIPQAPVDDVDIDIYEEIPTGPIEEEEIDLDEEIPTGPAEEELDLDEEIPTGPGDMLPQTGTVPITSFALLGGILIACGAFFVWKREEN